MESVNGAAIAPIIVLGVGFVVFCLVSAFRYDVKHLPRWAWVLIILLSIPLGGVLYLILGRGELRSRA